MWRPGPVGAKDGFITLVGDFGVIMAPVARVLILVIGMQTSWFRTLVLTGLSFPICDLWWIVALRGMALGGGLLSL